MIMQTQFNKFNNTIKIGYDDSQVLRDKRDLLLQNLRDGLKSLFTRTPPAYDSFNQGSYIMGTGVKPLDGEDYDIDIGILFRFSKDSYSPTQVKQWVFEALNTTWNRTVEYKRPCIRVQYHQSGEVAYHVDLAVYSGADYDYGTTYLAKGFPGSKQEYQIWEQSEPDRLKAIFQEKFQNENDRNQFRRIIRFLKRWKDVKFSASGNDRPTGIALTACAINWFKISTPYSYLENKYCYNDLVALKNLVISIIDQFNYLNRIVVNLPVQPHNNLFKKMSDRQMVNFKNELMFLKYTLIQAENEINSSSACRILQSVFGTDFPLS